MALHKSLSRNIMQTTSPIIVSDAHSEVDSLGQAAGRDCDHFPADVIGLRLLAAGQPGFARARGGTTARLYPPLDHLGAEVPRRKRKFQEENLRSPLIVKMFHSAAP